MRISISSFLGAVHEWCINTAAVDPATDSVMVNSEDGNMYRWNLISNTLTQVVNITNGLGEAYTPTEIGPDGTVYAINDATLWAIGATPSSAVYSTWRATGGGSWKTAGSWSAGTPGLGGDVATFDTSISGASVVTIDGGAKIGTLTFYSPASYTIAQGTGGQLAMDNGTSTSPAQIIDCLGNHSISAPVLLGSNTTIAVGQTSNVLTISGNIIGSKGTHAGQYLGGVERGNGRSFGPKQLLRWHDRYRRNAQHRRQRRRWPTAPSASPVVCFNLPPIPDWRRR